MGEAQPFGRPRRPRDADVKPGSSTEKQEYPSLGSAGGAQSQRGAEQFEGRRFDRGDGRTSFQPKSDRGRGKGGKSGGYHERSDIGPSGDMNVLQTSFPPLGGERQEMESKPSEQSVTMPQESGKGRVRGKGRGRGQGRDSGVPRSGDSGVPVLEEKLSHMQLKQEPGPSFGIPSPPYTESRPRPPQQQEVKMPTTVPRTHGTEMTPPPTPPQQEAMKAPLLGKNTNFFFPKYK